MADPAMATATVLPAGSTVAVRVPASSANLGPGFDTIGLALGVWDEYRVEVVGEGLVIDVEGEGADDVPRTADHLVHRCLVQGLAELGAHVPTGLRLSCTNRVPHSRGMGSSATAAVAGYALASALHCLALTGEARIDLDAVGAWAATREGHADNSSASVYGGLTISWCEGGDLRAVRTAVLRLHPDVEPVVLVPQVRLATATARAALPAQVPLADAASGAGRAALLVEAATRRPELLLPATRDVLHQEQRRGAYPASMVLVDGLRADGHAAVISGAGPTVLVLTTEPGAVLARALPVGWRALAPGVPTHGVAVAPG